MNLLVISGSTRRDSLNTRLARLVRDLRPADTVTIIKDLNTLPFYDADLEEAAGFPPAVAALRERVAVADVVVAVTPEYNGTIPGVLGNAIDWLSRPPGGSVLDAKPTLVLSASPSRSGGIRAAQHLRAVLTDVGADVADRGMSVPSAHRRLNVRAKVDPELAASLADLLGQTLDRRRPAPSRASTDINAA